MGGFLLSPAGRRGEGGGEGVKGKATKSRALLATRARSSSLLAPPWIGDCLDPPPRSRGGCGGRGREPISRIVVVYRSPHGDYGRETFHVVHFRGS